MDIESRGTGEKNVKNQKVEKIVKKWKFSLILSFLNRIKVLLRDVLERQ